MIPGTSTVPGATLTAPLLHPGPYVYPYCASTPPKEEYPSVVPDDGFKRDTEDRMNGGISRQLLQLYNFIITSYTKSNSPEDVIIVYLHMRSTGMPLDEFIIPSILKACTESQAVDQGKEVRGFVTKVGLDWDPLYH
ncbi:Pentatricopeptide repeat-containing protein [Nymphaea thermarum]|nr:Pentatricopeptide repeat-containing protein [Nymphaea thermarum]